jgi:enoyl-[acyl-carrier protein] reductase III
MQIDSSLPLAGKWALVTGGSKGIGRATAESLARSGANVIINFVTSEAEALEVGKAVQEIGREALVIRADVSQPDDIKSMFEMIEENCGTLDILISNAAGGGFRNVLDASPVHFDTAMHTNARSLILLTQSARPLMVTSQNESTSGPKSMKKIVAITSHGSFRALPAYGIIGASKAAIESLIRHLALEMGPLGVNCNCVLAGLVRTNSTEHVPGAEEMFKHMDSKLLLPKGTTLLAKHVAQAVTFLALPTSDLIQGATLVIDGGASLPV